MLKVLKFGGTSVGTIDSLRNVKAIVEGLDAPAIVVVSALGGLTDKLIATANSSAEGSEHYREEMVNIRKRHHDIINELVPDDKKGSVTEKVDSLLNLLEERYQGLSLIKTLPVKTLDEIVSFGERMSSVIVAAIIAGAEHRNSLDFVKTEKWFNRNIADRPLTERLIKETFRLPLTNHIVTGGFISTDRDTGEITNLGRGGSDYTAALIAAALDADLLEIWTDVDGFLTADPRIIKDARIIPEMSFVESMELCSFGAKVIYPPTIYPVFHKNIPIKILNTFNPTAPGTHISDNVVGKGRVRGVSSLNNTAMVTMSGPLTANVAEINSRAYNAMARNGISVFMVAQPSEESSFSIAMPSGDSEKALEQLVLEFSPELQTGELRSIDKTDNLSVVALVGEGIKNVRNLGNEIVAALKSAGIDVKAISAGASETTVAAVVPSDSVKDALRVSHSVCFK
ncbi:MAG: aspartate kinase [Bacteroides sp.]|nr:aspartate kinase [Bacteroides sp.]